jgi:hypothetical protein
MRIGFDQCQVSPVFDAPMLSVVRGAVPVDTTLVLWYIVSALFGRVTRPGVFVWRLIYNPV